MEVMYLAEDLSSSFEFIIIRISTESTKLTGMEYDWLKYTMWTQQSIILTQTMQILIFQFFGLELTNFGEYSSELASIDNNQRKPTWLLKYFDT